MRNLRKILRVGLPAMIFAMAAYGTNVTTVYVTPSGSTTSGPVSASASFTMGVGFVNITLTNLGSNPTDVSQLLSDLSFTLSNGATSGTLASSAGQQITVFSGGKYSFGSTGPTGWGLRNNVSGGLQLDALGFIGPAGLILGSPGAGATYSNANSSIAGNPAHNPFIFTTATFTINIAGVTSATTITSATFSFGTTPGQNLIQGCLSTNPACGSSPGPTQGVPEPVSFTLGGTGLIAIYFIGRRRANSRRSRPPQS